MSATGNAVRSVQAPANQAALEHKLKLQSTMKRGAGWFMAVALFSIVNSALMLTDAKIHFIIGLGITQIADGVGRVGGPAGSVAGFIITLITAGVFLLFWKFSREGQKWAFLVGMILYTLDGLIFLGFGLWLDLGFHAFALFNMYKGLQALNQMNSQPSKKLGVPPILAAFFAARMGTLTASRSSKQIPRSPILAQASIKEAFFAEFLLGESHHAISHSRPPGPGSLSRRSRLHGHV